MKRKILPMNLQFFAEGPGDGPEGGTGDIGQNGNEPKSFDDILSDETYKAEFDKRIQEALKAQEDKLKVLFDEKATEAEKLAKMSKDEKEKYLEQKKEKELNEREIAITRRELMAEAKNTLAEKKLPVELAEVLDYTDAGTCKASIESVEKAFSKAVEAAVEERLKGGKPPKKGPTDKETGNGSNMFVGIIKENQSKR